MVLLQQPLRGAWRPYDLPRATSARMRPKARRMEFELPLDTDGPNYNPDFGAARPEASKAKRGKARKGAADDDEGGDMADGGPDRGSKKGGAGGDKPMDKLLLRSQAVEGGGADYAVGVVRGGRLLLVPVDYALQLRPHLPHLSVPTAEGKPRGGGGGGAGRGVAGDSDAEGGEEGEGGEESKGLVEVEVQVKRRETERQAAARLKSYSHITAEEDAEEWRRLQVTEVSASGGVWASLAPGEGAEEALPPLAPLARADYLRLITPGAGGPGVTPAGAKGTGLPAPTGRGDMAPPRPRAGAGTAAAAGGGGAGPSAAGGGASTSGGGGAASRPHAGAMSAEAAGAVRRALRELFRSHSVANLQDIRGHLAGCDPSSTARQGAALSDDALHEVITAGGEFAALQRAYAAMPAPKDPAGELRGVILELLAGRSTVGVGVWGVLGGLGGCGVNGAGCVEGGVRRRVVQWGRWSRRRLARGS